MNNIFSKMDKKILVILIVILAVILVAGFFVYKYMNNKASNVENSIGGTNTENIPQNSQGAADNNQDAPQVQITAGGDAQVNGSDLGGGLTVCLDKCGDSICQATAAETNCTGSNTNCICVESNKECSQDCK